MELLISFCHFCEIHGPSVMFTTRPVKNCKGNFHHRKSSTFRPRDSFADEQDDNTQDISCLFDDRIDDNDADISTNEKKVAGCEGCTLHANTKKCDLLSFNHNRTVCFLTDSSSESTTELPNCFKPNDIRVASLRSLSCELYPKNRAMLYFGDEKNGHVLSFLFSLQDSKARGFQRKYSIVLMCRQNQQLFNNWFWLVKNITVIISFLQQKARDVYRAELNPEARLNKRSIILDKVATAGKNLNYFEEIFGLDSSDTRKNKIKSRSLLEITGDANVLYALHMKFASIIAEIGRRFSSNNRDMLLSSYIIDPSQDIRYNRHFDLRALYLLIGSEHFRQIACNIVLGNRIIVYDSGVNSKQHIESFIDALIKLLPHERVKAVAVFDEPPFASSNSVEQQKLCNLVGICSELHEASMQQLVQDFYLCIEICDNRRLASTAVPNREQASLRECRLKIHCCDDITSLPIPNYVVQVEQLLKDVSISDETVNARIDCLKTEWLNKCKTLRNLVTDSTSLDDQKVQSLLKLLKMTGDDLHLLQTWTKIYSTNGVTRQI